MAIANADGSIVLTTKVDQSGLKKGMTTMKSGVSSLIGSFGKLATAIGLAFSVGALVKFSKEASNLATTAEASVQRLIDIYGSASQAVGDFIDANAQALGMSRAAAASYASVYGNLFSVWADQQTNAALTTQYLQMTAVVASKTGRTVEDVQERIRSGLLGNTEAIEDLGIFVNVKTIEMTDAFQRMAGGRSWEQLDAYTQQQIRSMAILEQATEKYGDEVAQTTALTKSQFQAAWQDFQATWGQVVNRVLMPVLEVLTDILKTATDVMQTLFGISSSTISQSEDTEKATQNQEELTKAVKETEKAAKKAVAPFDDLQIISNNTYQNVSEDIIFPKPSNGGSLEIIETEKTEKELSSFSKTIKKIAKKIKKAFEPLSKISFSNLEHSLSSLKEPLDNLVSVSWDVLEGAIEKVIAPLAEFVIEDALPRFFDTLGTSIDGFRVVLDKGWDIFEQFIDEFLDPLWQYTEPKVLTIWDNFNEELNEFVSIVEQSEVWEDFETILSEIYDLSSPVSQVVIDFTSAISNFAISVSFVQLKEIFEGIEDAVGGIADVINGDFDGAWGHLEELFSNDFLSIEAAKFQAIRDAVKEITGFDISEWLKENWENVKKVWKEEISPVFTKKWWEDVFSVIGFAFGSVLSSICEDFASVINWIVDAASFSFPAWKILGDLSGKTFGIDIKKIEVPKLAQGAVIPANREFLAVLGDQRQGVNIETPLATMVEAFQMALDSRSGYNGGGNTEVVLEIDGREFGRAVVEQGNRENRRIGTRLVIA